MVERVQSFDLFGMYLSLLQDYNIQMAQMVFNVLQYTASYFRTVKAMGDMANNDVFCGGVDNACDLQQNIDYQKKQLAFAKDVGDKAGEARACGYLSDAFDSVGDFQQALEYGKKHLCIVKVVGDLSEEGQAYGNLGNAYESLLDFQRARECHTRSLTIAKKTKDRIA